MITPSGNGVLIDWEFAKKIPSGSERGRAIDRTVSFGSLCIACSHICVGHMAVYIFCSPPIPKEAPFTT